MKRIKIKGSIISNSEIKTYKQQGREYTALQDLDLTNSSEPLEVIINSSGGDVTTASEIYSMLKAYQGFVTVKIVGLAASAASVIAMAGDVVEMSPTGLFMIHNASTATYGNTQQHYKQMKLLETTNATLAQAYQEKTGLDNSFIRDLMEKETYMTCDKALELGFVDKKMFAKKMSADDVKTILKNAPEQVVHNYLEEVIKKNAEWFPSQDEVKESAIHDKMVRLASATDKMAELTLLEVRARALEEYDKELERQAYEDERQGYNKEYLKQGYQYGDVVLTEDGRTVIIARSQEEYEAIARRLKS